MILLPSRRITKPQAGGSVDIQRAYDTGTFYLSFADASFTDRIGGGVVRNPGGLSLGPNGRIATFNGAQQGNSPLWLNGSHVGIIVAARVRATAAQAGTPGAAFGVYDGTSQGGFGVGFDTSGNAGAALLTSAGAYLSSGAPVGLNKWVTVFAQITGGSAGFSYSYVDGKPATTGQGASYAGDPRSPSEIAYGAQHRSAGFLRQFKGDIEWAAVLRVSPPDGGDRSLTDQLALDLYHSGYPYNLINTTRRTYFDMGAGGGATPVSSDQAATYSIRGAVSSDQAASYAIRSSVSADLSASYNIQTAIAVISDLSSGYEIRTSAQSDASAEYAIRASVQADSGAAYEVRSSVQSDVGAAFVVRGSVLSDASASYVVRTSASADLVAAYEIQTASGVSSSLDASYNVRAAVQADAYAAYDLRTAVGAISEHAFIVRGLVSSDLDASYTVEAAITQVYADLQAAYLVDGGAVVIPSQFVASVPAGIFSARAPSGEYSATVPAGIFKASI